MSRCRPSSFSKGQAKGQGLRSLHLKMGVTPRPAVDKYSTSFRGKTIERGILELENEPQVCVAQTLSPGRGDLGRSQAQGGAS